MTSYAPYAFISSLIILMSLSACTEDCEAPDVDAINAIYLQFATDGAEGSFSEQELDQMIMVRYQQAEFDSFSFGVDTTNISSFIDESGRLRISRETPEIGTGGPPYYTDYMYRFFNFDNDWQVRLQQIELEGTYIDEEECEYQALQKTFFLNEDSIDATGSLSYVEVRKD